MQIFKIHLFFRLQSLAYAPNLQQPKTKTFHFSLFSCVSTVSFSVLNFENKGGFLRKCADCLVCRIVQSEKNLFNLFRLCFDIFFLIFRTQAVITVSDFFQGNSSTDKHVSGACVVWSPAVITSLLCGARCQIREDFVC